MYPPPSNPAVLIPARLASQRLPRKMLRPLLGRPLIQWTYETACKAFGSSRVWILTDELEIASAARQFHAQVVMTPSECENGTARIEWALKHTLQDLQADAIVGLQGDEPLLPLRALQTTLEALQRDDTAVMSTLTTPLTAEEFENPSVVKCVTTHSGRALYFSRSPIPNPGWHKDRRGLPGTARRHVGLYIWRRSFLQDRFCQLPPSTLQQAEDLEQLRLLEAGYTIQIAHWPDPLPPGVDTAEDLLRVEALLRTHL